MLLLNEPVALLDTSAWVAIAQRQLYGYYVQWAHNEAGSPKIITTEPVRRELEGLLVNLAADKIRYLSLKPILRDFLPRYTVDVPEYFRVRAIDDWRKSVKGKTGGRTSMPDSVDIQLAALTYAIAVDRDKPVYVATADTHIIAPLKAMSAECHNIVLWTPATTDVAVLQRAGIQLVVTDTAISQGGLKMPQDAFVPLETRNEYLLVATNVLLKGGYVIDVAVGIRQFPQDKAPSNVEGGRWVRLFRHDYLKPGYFESILPTIAPRGQGQEFATLSAASLNFHLYRVDPKIRAEGTSARKDRSDRLESLLDMNADSHIFPSYRALRWAYVPMRFITKHTPDSYNKRIKPLLHL